MSQIVQGAKNAKTITFPKTIREVRDDVFAHMTVRAAVLNEGLETLGKCRSDSHNGVFAGTRLRHVALPSTLQVLGDRTFAECKKLREVAFEKGSRLKSIGKYAFSYCYSLKRIGLPETLETIGDIAFFEIGLEEITLPRALKDAEWQVFDVGKSLKAVHVEDGCEAALSFAGIPDSAVVGPPPETSVGGVNVWDLRALK